MNAGRSLSYTAADRDRHYAGHSLPSECPVCLAGMSVSHGSGPRYAERLGPNWWADSSPVLDDIPPMPKLPANYYEPDAQGWRPIIAAPDGIIDAGYAYERELPDGDRQYTRSRPTCPCEVCYCPSTNIAPGLGHPVCGSCVIGLHLMKRRPGQPEHVLEDEDTARDRLALRDERMGKG